MDKFNITDVVLIVSAFMIGSKLFSVLGVDSNDNYQSDRKMKIVTPTTSDNFIRVGKQLLGKCQESCSQWRKAPNKPTYHATKHEGNFTLKQLIHQVTTCHNSITEAVNNMSITGLEDICSHEVVKQLTDFITLLQAKGITVERNILNHDNIEIMERRHSNKGEYLRVKMEFQEKYLAFDQKKNLVFGEFDKHRAVKDEWVFCYNTIQDKWLLSDIGKTLSDGLI